VSGTHSVPVYKIHPGIGIARLGNSPDAFCISPETPAALPIACDSQGNPLLSADGTTPVRVTKFKDDEGRIKRQAARFQIFVYDEKSPDGRPLAIGDHIEGGGNAGTLVDIQWRVYLANKKACWYEFQQLEGEHGYPDGHPLRNASITDSHARQRLIIDPGPQVVSLLSNRRAKFDRGTGDLYASTFPPEDLEPRKIDTLGEILSNDGAQLLVLGGHGDSGTFLHGFGQPRIDHYANNNGWFDDTSDGPVTARLIMQSPEVDRTRYVDVEYPAWVICAYPAYVPQVLDIVTLDDVVYNTAVTKFATRTDIYGKAGTFNEPQQIDPTDAPALALWQASALMWNPDYKPWFYRDIWPIIFRADEYSYLSNVLAQSNYPHNQTSRGNFDPDKLSIPPQVNATAYARASQHAVQANNSSQLFFEALDSELLLLDRQAENSRRVHRQVKLFRAAGTLSARAELEQALRNFAAVASGGVPDTDPAQYLAHWKQAYADSQEPESDRNEAYLNARERLQAAIRAFAKELEEPLEEASVENRRSGGPKPANVPPSQQPATTEHVVENILERLSSTFRSGKLLDDTLSRALGQATHDRFAPYRQYLFDLLRKEGEENVFRVETKPTSRIHHLPLMPLLSGDNPISNDLPSKFLRLTDVQLYLLGQWREGKFCNEILEGWVPKKDIDPWQPFANIQSKTGHQLDRHVLTNLAGGAFCPGAEVGWTIRNPSIYLEPYRIKADPLFSSFRQTAANENQSVGAFPVPEQDYIAYIGTGLSQGSDYDVGLQAGDLTKMMALPWQADFNECSTQSIDVTYELWNQINPDSDNDPWIKREDKVWETLWWPAHRPMQVFELIEGTEKKPNFQIYNWAHGIPQTKAGDLKMVTEWERLGFVIRNPYVPPDQLNQPSPLPPPKYVSVERNRDRGEPQ
jgi:hypothetical protein